MGWMSKEEQFDSGCELQMYLLYQDIHSGSRVLSAFYSMVPVYWAVELLGVYLTSPPLE